MVKMTSKPLKTRRIAVLSDTHGHLSPSLVTALSRVDMIIHAGDLDRPEILAKLKKLAPVIAVRGNMDRGRWAQNMLPAEMTSVQGIDLYILHDLVKLDIDPAPIGIRIVISGHTHRPAIVEKEGVIYLNPGSASQPRGGAMPSYALLTITDQDLDVTIKDI